LLLVPLDRHYHHHLLLLLLSNLCTFTFTAAEVFAAERSTNSDRARERRSTREQEKRGKPPPLHTHIHPTTHHHNG
jgi:hypothetical protein